MEGDERVLQRQMAALAELLRDPLQAEGRDAAEQADGALGDRKIGDVVEVAVQGRGLGRLGGFAVRARLPARDGA